jgi:GcrA cell cycle regulator
MKSDYPAPHKEFLAELGALDISASTIALRMNERFGTSYSKGSVHAKMQRLGIPRDHYSGSMRDTWTPERIEIFNQGIRENLGNCAIGRLCGVDTKTVYLRIKKVGIEDRIVPRGKTIDWSPEEEKRLAELLKIMTRADAAATLGRSVNSVASKMAALGLRVIKIDQMGPRAKAAFTGGKPRSKPKAASPYKSNRLGAVNGMVAGYVSLGIPATAEGLAMVDKDLALPESRRISIDTLRNSTCRFPIGHPRDEGFSYCGAPGADYAAGKPYCKSHAQLAYRPSQDRKREDRYILRVTQRVLA